MGRALTGIAAAAWVPLIAVFSRLFRPKDAIMATSLITLASSVGRMLATALNGMLNEWGGHVLAFYVAAVAAGLAALILLPAPIERTAPGGKEWKRGAGQLLRRRDIMIPTALNTIAMFGVFGLVYGFLPILAETLGANDPVKGFLLSTHLVLYTAGNLLNTSFIRKVKTSMLISISFVVFCAGGIALALSQTITSLFAFTAVIGFVNGFRYPTLMGLAIAHVDPEQRSTAMGIHQAVYSIGMFAGPWVAGLLADSLGLRQMFVVVSLFCLVLSHIFLFVQIRR